MSSLGSAYLSQAEMRPETGFLGSNYLGLLFA